MSYSAFSSRTPAGSDGESAYQNGREVSAGAALGRPFQGHFAANLAAKLLMAENSQSI
jgi:hypothetical protein